MTSPCVLLAAGGTGGHLFPAYALAEELARRGITIDLATDTRGDRYGTGFPARAIYQLSSATLKSRSPIAAARTGFSLANGLRQAYALVGRLKPGCVVGFGGYPSFPPLLAARLRGIPTLLHEQNAVLGRANRMLAKRVSAIATSFERVKFLDATLAAKTTFTGNPVRSSVIEWSNRPYRSAGLAEPFTLLVFGGSQGARYFSDAVPPALVRLPADLRTRLRVVQQARDEDLARVRAAYQAAGVAAEVNTFFGNLPEIMAAAHLVIARAGASSVAEVAVMGRPSILVPLPHALDNDQLQNATNLAESGGGWCIEQKDLSVERLATELERLMRSPGSLSAAATKAKSAGRPDAVARLADVTIGLLTRM